MLKTAVPEIHVSSSATAKDFYSGKLGFDCEHAWRPDPTKDDPCYMTFIRDGVRLNITSFRDGVLGASVYVYVDDVDGLHAEFVANGVRASPVMDQSWGTREFGAADPDHNKLRFGQHLRTGPSD